MTHRSPLRSEHLRLGARLVEFAGWEMPLQYEGIISEHHAVRNAAGLFDVSHLGKVIVEGSGGRAALDRLLPGAIASLEPWTAAYNLVLDDSGGIVDDIFVYRHPGSLDGMAQPPVNRQSAQGGYLVVPNAANARRVFDLISESARGEVKVTDAHLDWAIIALSGPASREVLAPEVPEARDLRLHHFVQASLRQIPVLVARTGYTGELTFEILVEAARAESVWEALLAVGRPYGVMPAGLGARDLLRLEMGYPLHGQDLTVATNPIEAGLDWVVQWEKQFKGKQALERIREDGAQRKLVGLVAHSRRIPRRGARLVRGESEVGEVTSGNFSPSLDAGIALGYVRIDLAREGTAMEAVLDGRTIQVEVTATPFLKAKRAPGPGVRRVPSRARKEVDGLHPPHP